METTPDKTPQASSGNTVKWIIGVIIAIVIVIVIMRLLPGRPEVPEEAALPTALEAPPPLRAEPIAIAHAPIPEDRKDMLGIVRLRDLHTFAQRLGDFLTAVDPSFDTDIITSVLKDAGVDSARCHPGGNAALFAWKPEPLLSAPRLNALLPLPGYEIPAQAPERLDYASFDSYTLLTWETNQMDTVLPIRAELREIAQAPMDSGFSASINIRRIWENYGSMARLSARTAQGLLGLQLLQHPAFAEDAKTTGLITSLIDVLFQSIFDVLDQTAFITADVDLDSDRVQASIIVTARAGSALAAALGGGPLETPDLISLLPDHAEAFAVSQQTVADWTPTLNILKLLPRPALESFDAELLNQLDRLTEQLPKCGQTSMAMSMHPAENEYGATISARYIILSENAAAMYDLIDGQLSQGLQSDAFNRLYETLGIDLDVTATALDAPSIRHPGRRVEMQISPHANAGALGLQPEAMEAMRQSVIYEAALLHPFVLLTMNTPVEELARHLVSAAPASVHSLFREYEPGIESIGLLRPEAFADMIANAIPADIRDQIGNPPSPYAADTAPVTYATYIQDGNRKTIIRIPTSLIKDTLSFARQQTR